MSEFSFSHSLLPSKISDGFDKSLDEKCHPGYLEIYLNNKLVDSNCLSFLLTSSDENCYENVTNNYVIDWKHVLMVSTLKKKIKKVENVEILKIGVTFN